MRVLIAGCNGLLGQNLLRTSAGLGHRILGAARHPDPVLPGLLSEYRSLDITDPLAWERARAELRPDLIVNTAAFTDVDGCERDPERCDRVNRDAVGRMVETGVPLVHLSTDYVFDGIAGPYREDDPPHPLSRYGRAKLESETLALSGSASSLVVRTTWVWGRGRGAKKSFTEFVRETLAAGKPVRAVTDQWGNPTLARDLAQAVWALVSAGRAGVYHASGSERMSRLDWAARAAEFYGLDAAGIQPVDTPSLRLDAARPLRSGLICDKLERDTGFRLGGLKEQLERYRADLDSDPDF